MGEPASPIIVEQMKLTRQVLDVSAKLVAVMNANMKVNLDLVEAVDALREEIEEVSKQLSGAKIATEKTLEVEEEDSEPEPVDLPPAQG